MSLSSTSGLPKNSSRAQTTSSTQRNKLKLLELTQRKSLNANDLISVESGTKQTSLGFISQRGHSRHKSQEGLKVSDISSENVLVACKNQKSQKGLKVSDVRSENGLVERKRQKSQVHKKYQGQSQEEPSLVNEVIPKKAVGCSKDMTCVPMSEQRTKPQRMPVSTKRRGSSRKAEQVVELNNRVMTRSMSTLSTISDIAVEPNLVNVSRVRACSIVIKRLHPAEISEINPPKKLLKRDDTSFLEGIVNNTHNPLDLAASSNLVPVIQTPISDTKNENNTLSTISDIAVEPNLVNVSDVRVCSIVIKRLHPAEIIKMSLPKKLLKKDETSFLEGIVQNIHNPLDLAASSNLVPLNSNQNNTTIESKTPNNNESEQESVDVPTDLNVLEDYWLSLYKSSDDSLSSYDSEKENGDMEGIEQNIHNPLDLAASSNLVPLNMNQNNTIIESKTPNNNESEQESEDVPTDLNVLEDYWLSLYKSSDDSLSSYDSEKENGDMEGIEQNIHNPLDLAASSNLVPVNMNQNKTATENIKTTQILDTKNENNTLSTISDIVVEPNLVNVSHIVSKRLHPAEISKYINKQLENDDTSCKNVCEVPAVSNQLALVHQPSRPKLNKASILKRKIISKSPSFKQKKTDTDNVDWLGLDRTVSVRSDKLMVITKKFNQPKVEKEPVKLKPHENNDLTVKRKCPEGNYGQTTLPNQSQEQFKNTHCNGEVTHLQRFEDKHLQKSIDEKQLKNGTVPSELKLRNRITLKETDSFDKVTTHNNPLSSQCNFNARSNLEVDSTQLQIQEKNPLKDSIFALPKPIRQEGDKQEDDDDDDASSVVSINVSSDILNFINNEQSPEQNKTTGTKFDRLSNYSEKYNDYKMCSKYTLNKAGPSGIRGTNSEISKRNDLYTSSLMAREREACLDHFPDEDPLENTIFEGFCKLYFRTSIDEHSGCILMHEVPNHVFSYVNSPQDTNRTDCAIGEIIKENFINPPVDLVLLFASFCVQFRKNHTLVRLGQCLKNNYDGEAQKAHEIWYNFFKGIIKSKYDPMPNICKCTFISMTLQTIFKEIVDAEVFTVVLKSLLTLQFYFKTQVQLLICINFLFQRGQTNNSLKLIPLEFATAVINQALLAFSHKNNKAFVYRVLKTFFKDLDYARRLYCHDKSAFTLFVETVESNNIGFLSLPIKQLQISGLETSSLENLEHTKTYSDSPLQQIEAFRRTIKCVFDARSLCAALERNFEIRALNPNEIYTHFKSAFKFELFYSALSLLRDHVKASLSDVIMSFISYEADKKRWDVCLKLFKSLLSFDPKSIKNFYANNSPVSNILTVVSVYLNNNNIMEALHIFTLHNLSKDPSYWEMDFFPCDLQRRMLICATFRDCLQSIDTQELYTVIMKLIPLQKSLEEPIDLTSHVRTVICGLVEKRLDSKAAKLVVLIFDEEKSNSFVLTRDHLYRALVVILCNEKEYSYAAMLYAKAQKRVPLYPQLPTRITNIGKEMFVEIYSCLTKQEMLAVFFALLKLYGNEIKNIGFSANFKVYRKRPTDEAPCIFDPYLSIKDDTIPAAIQRFKRAVRELIPNAIFKESLRNAIEVEKISLQEYMYKLNQSGSSSED